MKVQRIKLQFVIQINHALRNGVSGQILVIALHPVEHTEDKHEEDNVRTVTAM